MERVATKEGENSKTNKYIHAMIYSQESTITLFRLCVFWCCECACAPTRYTRERTYTLTAIKLRREGKRGGKLVTYAEKSIISRTS